MRSEVSSTQAPHPLEKRDGPCTGAALSSAHAFQPWESSAIMRGSHPSLLRPVSRMAILFFNQLLRQEMLLAADMHILLHCEGRLPGLCVNGPIARHADRVVGAIRIGAMKKRSRRWAHTRPQFPGKLAAAYNSPLLSVCPLGDIARQQDHQPFFKPGRPPPPMPSGRSQGNVARTRACLRVAEHL